MVKIYTILLLAASGDESGSLLQGVRTILPNSFNAGLEEQENFNPPGPRTELLDATPLGTKDCRFETIVKATKHTNFNKDRTGGAYGDIKTSTYQNTKTMIQNQTTYGGAYGDGFKVDDSKSEYIFKLTFKGGERTVTMEWAQKSWLTESEPSGFREIAISDSDGPVRWGKFKGLRSCGKLAAFCSTTGWWAAVGQYQTYKDGIPAWPVNKFIADTAELQCKVSPGMEGALQSIAKFMAQMALDGPFR